jgi:hypothetical protein
VGADASCVDDAGRIFVLGVPPDERRVDAGGPRLIRSG